MAPNLGGARALVRPPAQPPHPPRLPPTPHTPPHHPWNHGLLVSRGSKWNLSSPWNLRNPSIYESQGRTTNKISCESWENIRKKLKNNNLAVYAQAKLLKNTTQNILFGPDTLMGRISSKTSRISSKWSRISSNEHDHVAG